MTLSHPRFWAAPQPDPRRSVTTKATRTTDLQHFHRVLRATLLDARDTLDDDAYRALLAILQEHLTREHHRVVTGDLGRLRRAS